MNAAQMRALEQQLAAASIKAFFLMLLMFVLFNLIAAAIWYFVLKRAIREGIKEATLPEGYEVVLRHSDPSNPFPKI